MKDILSLIIVSACSSTMLNMLCKNRTFTMVMIWTFGLPPLSVSLWYRSFKTVENAYRSMASFMNASGSWMPLLQYFSHNAWSNRSLIQQHACSMNKYYGSEEGSYSESSKIFFPHYYLILCFFLDLYK